MKAVAKGTYVAAFLLMCTLPFDPLLNQRFVVFPVTILCVVLGLAAMYVCTLPDDQARGVKGGTP